MVRLSERMIERSLLSNTEVFKIKKGDSSFDMGWTAQKLDKTDLTFVRTLNQSNSKPYYLQYEKLQDTGRIQLRFNDTKKDMTIVSALGITKVGPVAQVNASGYIVSDTGISDIGKITKTFTLKDSGIYYSLLKIGYAQLIATNVFDSSVVHELADIYADVMARLLSIKFKNNFGSDALKGRLALTYYFYNGAVSIEDVALRIKVSQGEAAAMKIKNPNFFNGKPVTLSELLAVLKSEFPHFIDMSIPDMVRACQALYGVPSVFMMESPSYFLTVVANGHDKFNLFPSSALKDKDIRNSMVQCWSNIERLSIRI